MASELPEYPTVDMEWLVTENPQIILKNVGLGGKRGWNNTKDLEMGVPTASNSSADLHGFKPCSCKMDRKMLFKIVSANL